MQAPRQTRTAVNNTFGSVPQDSKTSNAKVQPGPHLSGKPPVNAQQPAATPSPIDPRVQSILAAPRPDGKSVKEKLDADAPVYLVKAAQDHYNKQKDNKEALDAVSKFYLNHVARDMAANGVKEEKIPAEKLAGVFNNEQIGKNLEEIASDPEFRKWSTEQQANAIEDTIRNNPDIAQLVAPYLQEGENYVNALRRMQSDYVGSTAFADAVAVAGTSEEGRDLVAEGMKTLSTLGLGEKELLAAGNTLAENIRSKYTPDAPKPVIDPNTNTPVQTDDGHDLASLPDGTFIALGKDGKPFADKYGNAWVYNQDGTAKTDAGSAYLQYNAKASAPFASYGGIWYLTAADGKGKTDAQGRPLVIDKEGNAPVVLDKNGKAVVDKAGNRLVFEPQGGKALIDSGTGNAVVIDPATGGIVEADGDGKIVAGKNGDPYAADQKTGKFVQDANGRYVQISKDHVAPGIVPGYVIDKNNTKVVVNPYRGGRPLADPATGKTVILDPKSNKPQLVPLDANGAPRQASDGRSIVYNETGNTVVPGKDREPDWLVDHAGMYIQNAGGNYIGVDKQTGLAAPVDSKGFIKDGNGLTPLWDIEANAPMKTTDGAHISVTSRGTMLALNAQGQVIVEEKSGRPYVIDPKTRSTVTNPGTGRSILLSNCGALVEYNADDGYQYLINPGTRTTVKTSDGLPVVMSVAAGVPYAVNADGTPVKNPATGNTVAYGLDGLPAKEISTGHYMEITASGKAHVMDLKANTPMAYKDPKSGAYQLVNQDGSDVTNPDTGNKVQLTPGSALRVEIDAATGKPMEDGKGNILLLGQDNRPLKTPQGNAVVADGKSGVPVAVDAQGKALAEPASGLPQVVNSDTGMPVADPMTGAPVSVDQVSGHPVQIDPKTGKPIKDPGTDLNIIANGRTGKPLRGPNGEPVVMAPGLGMPGYADMATNTFTAFDPATGKTMTNPVTGATVILDPDLGIPAEVLADKAGNLVLVDSSGRPRRDGKGNALLLDKETGQVVVKDATGNLVDANTGKKPEKVDIKVVAHLLPLLLVPYIAAGTAGKEKTPQAAPTSPPTETADAPAAPDAPTAVPDPSDFRTTPEDRAAMKASWDDIDWGDFAPTEPGAAYSYYEEQALAKKARNPDLASIPVEDLAALYRYTANAGNINQALRSGDPAKIAPFEPSIKAIRSALNQMRKLGYDYQGEVFRSINQSPSQIDTNWKIGTTVEDPGFISTSIDPELGNTFGNLRLKLKTNTGVDVSPLSMFAGESEIMIADGSRWDITGGGFYKESPDNRYAYRNLDQATLLDIQPETSVSAAAKASNPSGGIPESPGGSLDIAPVPNAEAAQKAVANTGKWARLGATLGAVFNVLDIAGGGAQLVFGGLQINDGIKNNNPYDIASGTLNVAGGGLAMGAGIASIAAGAAAAAAPLAGVAAVFGMVALIVDILKHQDDHNKFADKLGELFESLGILKDGWHDKAARAYYDAHGDPDPAPIAHGNLP